MGMIYMDDPDWVPPEDRGEGNNPRDDDYADSDEDLAKYDYNQQLKLLAEQQKQYLAALRESMAASQETSNAQLALAQEQMQMSREQRDYYDKNFKPLEDDLIARAKTGISESEAASTAEKYVRGSYDATQGALDRNYQRLGIDVNDPIYEKTNQSLDAFREAAVAGAKNDARYAANEATKNLKLSVAGMGRGIPASSLSTFNTSAQAIGQSAATAQAGAGGVAAANSSINNSTANNVMVNAAGLSQSSQLRAQTDYQRDINDTENVSNLAGIAGAGLGTYIGRRDRAEASNTIVTPKGISGSNIGNAGWRLSPNVID